MYAGRKNTLYGTEDTYAEKPRSWSARHRELYPSLLTLALFAYFGSAIVNGVSLALDPNARYWIGQSGFAVLIIVPVVIVAHVLQSYYRRPLYFAVIFSCALPPLMSFIIGFSYMAPVEEVVDRLLSTDCTTFREKFHIEQAYKAASSFYDDCLNAEAKNRSATVEVVKRDMVISQCPGYDPKASGFPREWLYLQSLEQTEHCAGWCFVGEGALWTHNPLSWDSCSAASGMTMKHTVARNAQRMVVNGLFGFFVASLIIFGLNEADMFPL